MDGLAALPPLREVIAAHGLDARKRLGQHFLLDLNLTRRIARAAAPLDQGLVIEVGPGPGGLTRALLLEGAGRVVAVEIDSRAIAALKELQAAADGRLDLVEADALKIDVATLGPAPRRIVANLPYNVSTALLVGWLHQADQIADMVLMFQKEVGDRLAAAPRSKDYGRLSVLAQHVCTVQRLFDVAPSAFVPPPKVVSSVVRLRPRPEGRSGRFAAPGEGHRRSLRPAPQDAAQLAGQRFQPVPWTSWSGWAFARPPGPRNYPWPISCGLPRLLTSEHSLIYGDAMIRSLAFNVFFYVFTLLTARGRDRAGADPHAGRAAQPAALVGARRGLGHALDRRHEGRDPRPRQPPRARPGPARQQAPQRKRRHPPRRPDPRHRLRGHAGAVPLCR